MQLSDISGAIQETCGSSSREEDIRHYSLALRDAFAAAMAEYSSISIDQGIMAGAPCIEHTRIPVYMILDAIEGHVDLQAVTRSYPSLTVEQIRHAIGFAKLVVECPLEYETSTAP